MLRIARSPPGPAPPDGRSGRTGPACGADFAGSILVVFPIGTAIAASPGAVESMLKPNTGGGGGPRAGLGRACAGLATSGSGGVGVSGHGGGGGSAAGEAGASGAGAGGSSGGAASACPPVPASASLVDVATAIDAGIKASQPDDSDAVALPTDAERDAFATAVYQAIHGDFAAACTLPPSYRFYDLDDAGVGRWLLVSEWDASSGTSQPTKGWGAYARLAMPAGAPRELAVEAPHPVKDSYTSVESADVAEKAFARYWMVAGSNRCADTHASGCDGTTNACGPNAEGTKAFRDSDAAHATKLPFWKVHAALSDAEPTVAFLQLHGNSASGCPGVDSMTAGALVSDSSGSWSATGSAGQFAAALEGQIAEIGRCGLDASTCDLCGTDNVEARASAGSTDACTTKGTLYGRFVHVEQSIALRKAYDPIVGATLATF